MIRNSNVNRVFNDLDAFRDFCREYGFVFNEANLYRRNSEAYYAFERKRKGEYFKNFNFICRKIWYLFTNYIMAKVISPIL